MQTPSDSGSDSSQAAQATRLLKDRTALLKKLESLSHIVNGQRSGTWVGKLASLHTGKTIDVDLTRRPAGGDSSYGNFGQEDGNRSLTCYIYGEPQCRRRKTRGEKGRVFHYGQGDWVRVVQEKHGLSFHFLGRIPAGYTGTLYLLAHNQQSAVPVFYKPQGVRKAT